MLFVLTERRLLKDFFFSNKNNFLYVCLKCMLSNRKYTHTHKKKPHLALPSYLSL